MRRLMILLVVLAMAGCTDRDLTGPDAALDRTVPVHPISVATWNVYYGADLDPLMLGTGPLPLRTLLVFGQVLGTDAPGRAAAIARQIAAEAPHLVGLQEVAEYWLQSPGDFLDEYGQIQNPYPNATDEVFDFLDLLVAALAAEGVDYVIASRTNTLEAELPMLNGSFNCEPCDDLRFRESVAILARSDVMTANPQQHLFTYNMPVEVEGMELEIVKGWASIDAEVKGGTYRFVTTHLEPADILPGHEIYEPVHTIQKAQAAELLGWLEGVRLPVIVTGDLNTEPNGTSTDAWGMFMDAGFDDAWTMASAAGDGFTANHQADLQNAESQLWHRIDYVLFRPKFTGPASPFLFAADATVIGAEQADRTLSGLWPSDHAGVAATIEVHPGGAAPGR